jgi:hypothetical protein
MEKCSRFIDEGLGKPCYGVTFTEGNQCWLKNVTFSEDPDKYIVDKSDDEKNFHSALVPLDYLGGYDDECPGNDLEPRQLGSVKYTLHCGKSFNGYDLCWDGSPANSSLTIRPDCWDVPFLGFYHVSSLEECLEICLSVQPLCHAAVFVPNLSTGYPNCWPKTGVPHVSEIVPPPEKDRIFHTAVINEWEPTGIDDKCPANDHYKTTDNKDFEIHCGQLNTGTNITSVHTRDITACIDACATNTDGCVGVVFDSSLVGGYQNCYLQNTTSINIDMEKRTYAKLSGTTIPTSSPPASANDNDKGSTSKAWVAGPVIGGIALLAVAAFGVFWWRRRKSHMAGVGTASDDAAKGSYTPYMGGAAAGLYSPPPGHEQHYGGTKYAHEGWIEPPAVEAPGVVEPQELASGAPVDAKRSPQELAS